MACLARVKAQAGCLSESPKLASYSIRITSLHGTRCSKDHCSVPSDRNQWICPYQTRQTLRCTTNRVDSRRGKLLLHRCVRSKLLHSGKTALPQLRYCLVPCDLLELANLPSPKLATGQGRECHTTTPRCECSDRSLIRTIHLRAPRCSAEVAIRITFAKYGRLRIFNSMARAFANIVLLLWLAIEVVSKEWRAYNSGECCRVATVAPLGVCTHRPWHAEGLGERKL